MPVKFDETADIQSVRSGHNELWLVISSAAGVRAVPLPRGPRATIGRMHTCDIVVDDESVSRQHAVVHTTAAGLAIEDLGSRNKTKVMGRALGRGESASLPAGSVVEIGYVTMFVQLGRPGVVRASTPSPSAPPPPGPPSTIPQPIVLDPTMQRLYALLEVIAPSPLNVLVLGETGTGKEVFAEAIHMGSRRATAPFLRVNCAALSGSLLESELFGHEKGAFTGALGAKAGLFEAADGGTVFLDEVGELPIDTQAKLLRVIERGEVIRLGSVQPRRVDVRYVAATNRELQQFIGEGRFRSDLFFRLNGFTVTLPPLRKRIREITPLARHFLGRAAQGRPYTITPEAQNALESYPWPGNVRELKNVVERAFVLSGAGARIEPDHLQLPEVRVPGDAAEMHGPNDTIPPTPYGSGSAAGTWPPPGVPIQPMGATPAMGVPAAMMNQPMHHTPMMGVPPAAGSDASLRSQRESWERQQILQALEKTSGNQKEAAKLLGISRRTLINKIEQYGIARPRKRTP
ncbi:MAG TPA: sigma 54-interacting transcriptional regulator [Labilithrix sp.]|jgi:transcriptional regulator with GAF, ATPase, and Fis domain